MLASFTELLRERQEQGGALGAFTCYNFETAMAVLDAAAIRDSAVIILISEKSFAAPYGAYLTLGLKALAAHAPIPVCLQLDHVSHLAQIEAAFELGIGVVMADGSRLPFEQNIAFVREAVQIARHYGGAIEAELGRIEGNEDSATIVQAGALTDPQQAALFVEQTDTSCLAVSIGNVHGVYQRPPVLDWQRLAHIHEQISIPLSLHGASGLADQDLNYAIQCGIRKINVNTELRSLYLEIATEQLPRVLPSMNLLALHNAQIAVLTQVVEAKMQVYTPRTAVE